MGITGIPFLIASTVPCSLVVITISIFAISDSISPAVLNPPSLFNKEVSIVTLAASMLLKSFSIEALAEPCRDLAPYSFCLCDRITPATGTTGGFPAKVKSGLFFLELSLSINNEKGFHTANDSIRERLIPIRRQLEKCCSNSVTGQPFPKGPQTNKRSV